MLRKDWKFEYTASKLADAAYTKQLHHKARCQWWEDQKAKVMEEVKESGLEVSESLALSYSNTMADRSPQIMVRNDLQRKFDECHKKIREHDEKAREYDGWRQVLTANPEARMSLNHDDWLFFFGA